MLIVGPTRVSLIDADPDLGRGMDAERAAAARRLTVPVLTLRRGAFCPDRDIPDLSGAFGLLVLDGLIVREALVGDHPSAELIGPGDLVRVEAEEDDRDSLLPRTVEWSVLSGARVALIAGGVVAAAAPWPELVVALIDRAARRADRLMVLQAITHLTRVDDRLHALLWYLAERWGRVVPEGVALTLRLPHRTLAGMVGARRPSVTTAFGQLLARGVVERRADGAWVLRGGPPDRHVEAGLAGPAAAVRSLPV